MTEEKIVAALGLGSNLGDTKANIDAAIAALGAVDGINVLKKSSDYRTPPWGPVLQDDYRNCCITLETSLSPRALLDAGLAVELQLGRVRDVRWGPRTIDIDLLIYDHASVEEEGLQVPHPRMGERAFVLIPLTEIWPDAELLDGRTAADALMTCGDKEGIYML
ncbi:2-amino-4-hydroxy-6-hydroxymethyldihydropteridine diphosphokinase [Pseudovibrio sp. Tun.PSC04-5.I4]|uniref:2-amino-4-hydroxy-6- hydroxymethyldihydropteridine diphosphokinase n=1 Tax=Pseudovibrio sp. Tun.PSC04-5.I4 TaxID=1798213 RepID=UPI00088C6B22|nr:2-amino-4-hydroxy-6-hydroxymethyldihydropteridine diphosphokinase [Pseudovibrio sp. Tun.PSC04-5.I4]SDR28205.1 2-amino-4-hydroxy-6-hydroxymethyldihydropteridinediphosphokinase [Pseudovibrio sp. Tun.PSC04-5.I4]